MDCPGTPFSPGGLLGPGVLADLAVRDPPLYPLVPLVLLVHVYQVILLAQVFLGGPVYLWVLVFPVFQCYLLVLDDRAFHPWHRFDSAADEVVL